MNVASVGDSTHFGYGNISFSCEDFCSPSSIEQSCLSWLCLQAGKNLGTHQLSSYGNLVFYEHFFIHLSAFICRYLFIESYDSVYILHLLRLLIGL